jgi:hypothetical protein
MSASNMRDTASVCGGPQGTNDENHAAFCTILELNLVGCSEAMVPIVWIHKCIPGVDLVEETVRVQMKFLSQLMNRGLRREIKRRPGHLKLHQYLWIAWP